MHCSLAAFSLSSLLPLLISHSHGPSFARTRPSLPRPALTYRDTPCAPAANAALCSRSSAMDVDEHVFELYLSREVSDSLGWIDRATDVIEVELPLSKVHMTIRQSLSQLSSSSSSTGFVCWNTSQHLVDWLLSHRPIELEGLTVLELGSGVSGICGSQLAPLTKLFVCSDQKSILKLLKSNIVDNLGITVNSRTLGMATGSLHTLEVVEIDWEDLETGMQNYTEVSAMPDLIIACDTIYNEYLIPYFLDAVERFGVRCIVGVQLRDPLTLETFLRQCVQRFQVSVFEDHQLSQPLREGFVVYSLAPQ